LAPQTISFDASSSIVTAWFQVSQRKRLVYFEEHATAPLAIQREKNIKHWSREWKIDLIVSMNPDWRDLYDEIAM
jgi:predicted GIY-YIG superfamily endonuclease